MRPQLFACAALIFSLSSNLYAAPSVTVDIAPLHSLVSQVMEDVAKPKLIIPAEASPHQYTLRPSEAKALADADVVFWVSEDLTPWLEKALENLSGSAKKVKMLSLDGATTYAFREGATFESHAKHDEEEKEHKDEHESEQHDDDAEHHDHEGIDPHAWLDPENAKVWVKVISETLSKQDPENAAIYSRNADTATTSLDALIAATQTQINALGQPNFIVFHDAYQYFEKRFDIPAAGSISLSDAEDPSPARIQRIRETIQKLGVSCVFTEPQFNPGMVKNVFADTNVSTIGIMDPLGANIATGSGHYSALIQAMVSSVSECK